MFTATGADAYGNPLPITPIWSTDAGVMTGNTLTAQTTPAAGLHVTATVGAVSGSAVVNIVAGPLVRLEIAPTSVTLPMRAQQQFSAIGYDAYGNPLAGLSLIWQVLDDDAGTIDGAGLFTAGTVAGVFDATLVVQSGSVSATADVVVVWPCQVYLPIVALNAGQ